MYRAWDKLVLLIVEGKLGLVYNILKVSILAKKKNEANMYNWDIMMIGMRVSRQSRPSLVLLMMQGWRFFPGSFHSLPYTKLSATS